MTATGTFRRYRARQEVVQRLNGALVSDMKWTTADDLPERELSEASTRKPSVIATVEVETDQETTFYGVRRPRGLLPLVGRTRKASTTAGFACTLEWGTSVRGRYELVCPPELVVMRWDFEDDNVPVPGGEMTGYLRISPVQQPGRRRSCRGPPAGGSTMHRKPVFMEVAWRMVLGRLKEGVVAASGPGTINLRSKRPKRRPPGASNR